VNAPNGQVPLPGSERQPLPGARPTGPVDPNERFEVTLILRGQQPPDELRKTAEQVGSLDPSARRHTSREEFERLTGTAEPDIAAVEAFAHEHGLGVSEVSSARHTVVLSGTAAAFSQAFGVQLERYEHPDGAYRGRTGTVQLPASLDGVVVGVFGLDDRPQARPHFRSAATLATGSSFTPVDIARLYAFPTGVDGSGQTVAILELGGGYSASDLRAYFKRLGVPIPVVSAVSVDGGHNRPTGTPNGPDAEVMLDIEVVGAVAPKARIVVYFAPNTDRGFLDALTMAIHDNIRKPSVVSISWGGPEASWTHQAMQAFDQAAQAAAALGVTICAAAGDNGSDDGVGDGKAHADFPASSPHILACGGTRLSGSGTNIAAETVWNDGAGGGATGGGISDEFALPSWQSGAHVPPSANPGGNIGRGLPDVAGDADPVTGYQVLVDGRRMVIGGTSAVAPLWAGLIALINQHLKSPVGYLNPLLYTKVPTGTLRDITSGTNGAYSARQGWDACTGFGSPDGARLMQAFSAGTSIGTRPA
jgi:kumamolisin